MCSLRKYDERGVFEGDFVPWRFVVSSRALRFSLAGVEGSRQAGSEGGREEGGTDGINRPPPSLPLAVKPQPGYDALPSLPACLPIPDSLGIPWADCFECWGFSDSIGVPSGCPFPHAEGTSGVGLTHPVPRSRVSGTSSISIAAAAAAAAAVFLQSRAAAAATIAAAAASAGAAAAVRGGDRRRLWPELPAGLRHPFPSAGCWLAFPSPLNPPSSST